MRRSPQLVAVELVVEIDHECLAALGRGNDGEADREGGFSAPAFLSDDGNSLHRIFL